MKIKHKQKATEIAERKKMERSGIFGKLSINAANGKSTTEGKRQQNVQPEFLKDASHSPTASMGKFNYSV